MARHLHQRGRDRMLAAGLLYPGYAVVTGWESGFPYGFRGQIRCLPCDPEGDDP